ncbi:MAG: sulfotransferase domain-containing protein [Solirubrobacterales bacterium]
MLIVANGAFKCGSTWQYDILRGLVETEPVPEEFRHPKWSNPSIDLEKLPDFLASGQHVAKNFVSKNHIHSDVKLARALIDDPHVMVFNLTRHLGDVLVSAYHHDVRIGKFSGDTIEEYYWGLGKGRIHGVLNDHRFWNVGHPGVFVGSCEALHTDFATEVQALASFLGLDLDASTLDQVQHETAFEKMADTGPGKHRRKGIVGDSRDILNDEVLKDLRLRTTSFQTRSPDKVGNKGRQA